MPRPARKTHLTLGIVQMTADNRHEPNMETATSMVADAANAGADLVAFPEVAGMMNRRISEERALIRDADSDPYINTCRDLARAHNIWIHTGSTPVITTGESRFRNRSNLIDPDGRIVAAYDKIHLFDATLSDGTSIRESKHYAAGQFSVMPQTPWGPVGLSICYDLRFPHLYRAYAREGAAILFVPSAFTVETGRAHWEILLRARAIETGAFVIAAAQTGTHADGRETWGHGMVVGPNGDVLLDQGQEPRLDLVTLDLSEVEAARARIPSLTNERSFTPRDPRPLEP